MKLENLGTFEREQLLHLVSQHWGPEDRQRIARTLPQVYAKLFDVRVVVDTLGSGTVVITAKEDKTKFSVTIPCDPFDGSDR